jgi:DNA-binding NarL/FixJ family response regulator
MEPDFWVVAQAASGEEALEMVHDLQPMVAVVDVNLPGLNGQQVTRQLMIEKFSTRVVLLTAYDDLEQKIHAMRVGAAAYCTKDVAPEQLVDTVRRVAAGSFVIGEQEFDAQGVTRWLDIQTEGTVRPYSDPGEPFQPLSAREMEVLAFVTGGMSNKEIATTLGISHQTVKNHVTAILRKLGVEDRTQAAIYALKRGWVRLHQQETETQE